MSKFFKLAALAFALLFLHGKPAHAAWYRMYSTTGFPLSAHGVADYLGSNPTPYICRAYYGGGIHPGWTMPGNGYCAFGWGGVEQDSYTYDLWVDDWQPASSGNVPANAIVFGYEQAAVPYPGLSLKRPRYACQAYDPGNGLASGKVAPDLGGCYFPYGGVELYAGAYNVLVDSSLTMIDKSIGTVYTVPLPDPSVFYRDTSFYFSSGEVPSLQYNFKGNVKSGYEPGGVQALSLCSAYYQDGYQIGKVRPGFPGCDISYGGQEVYVTTPSAGLPDYYWDLTLNFIGNPNDEDGWSGGVVPIDRSLGEGLYQSSIIGGQEQDGSSLYLCVTNSDTPYPAIPGKVRPGLGGCSIAWQGKEVIVNPYYVIAETYTKTLPQ